MILAEVRTVKPITLSINRRTKPYPIFGFLVFALSLLTASASLGKETAEVDWSAWQRLPLFEDGRIKPMDTFARRLVEKITGRQNPTLVPPRGNDRGAAGRELFPEGQPRTWSAHELVFSWLVEPEKWEDVPFLVASHETLRAKLLGVPVVDEAGHHLKYVSPRQVESSMAFEEYLRDLTRRRKEVEDQGGRFRMTGLDLHVARLWDAYATFRLLTYQPLPKAPISLPEHVKVVHPVPRRLQRLVALWEGIEPQVAQLCEIGALDLTGASSNPKSPQSEKSGDRSKALLTEISQTFQKLGQDATTLTIEELDREISQLQPKLQRIALAVETLRHRAFRVSAPEGANEERFNTLRTQLRILASRAQTLAREAEALNPMIYDTGAVPNVLPAVIGACLSTETEIGEPVSPWLSLGAVLYGSPTVLHGYDMERIAAARAAFEKAASAYRSHRPDQLATVSQNLREFARLLQELGHSVESERQNLPVDEAHRDLLAQTAYPEPGHTDLEVFYNAFDPFRWSWITNLVAFAALVLAFGRVRRPMLAVGLAILITAQCLTVFGFVLRVMISGWAPVTNMFESIVFVSLVIGLLGIWFVVQPVVGEAVRRAWAFVSLPFEPLAKVAESAVAPVGTFVRLARAVLVAARVALGAVLFYYLAVVPYDIGKSRAVFDLWPEIARSLGNPSFTSVLMNLLGWFVGICILLTIVWLVPRLVAAIGVAVFATIPTALKGPELRAKLDHAVARYPFAVAAAGLSFLTAVIAYFTPVWDKGIEALQPVLRDRLWLFAHVLTVTAGYGAGLLGWGLGNIALGYYLFGRYRLVEVGERRLKGERHRPQSGEFSGSRFVEAPEACYSLAQYIYKAIQVAVILLTAGTILGGVWADRAWGRFWGWDPKEVWALISILVYMAILHGRYAGWVNTFGIAAGSVIGMISVVWAWYGTNYLMPAGLHAYAGEGSGGGLYVVGAFTANLLFVGLAWARYKRELEKASTPALKTAVSSPQISRGEVHIPS